MNRFGLFLAAATLLTTTSGCQSMSNLFGLNQWQTGFSTVDSCCGGCNGWGTSTVAAGGFLNQTTDVVSAFPTAPSCSSCGGGALLGAGAVMTPGVQVIPGGQVVVPGATVQQAPSLQPTPAQVMPGPANSNDAVR